MTSEGTTPNWRSVVDELNLQISAADLIVSYYILSRETFPFFMTQHVLHLVLQ